LAAEAAVDADPVARRRREQQQQLDNDLQNAAGLLGVTSISGSPTDLLATEFRTKDELEAFANKLANRLHVDHGLKPLYPSFVEALVKSLCAPLRDLEVRKTSSALSALANEKQRIQRETEKGIKKKAAKPTLGVARGHLGRDTRAYNEALDDDDLEFM